MTDFSKLWSDRGLEMAQVASLVRAVFPDPRITIARELVEAVASALPDEVQENLFGQAIGLALGANVPPVETDQIIGYYEARATHTRPGVHSFTARLPMARVVLPETQQDISTNIGIVFAGDHRLYTRPLFVEHYAGFLGYEPDRIELLTPARYLGARFAAVATYVLFKGGVYQGFALEAGMATGEPMVLYCSKDGMPIVRRTGYSPTPFSSSSNYYQGSFTYSATRGEPVALGVEVMAKKDADCSMHVEVQYTRFDDMPTTWPAQLTVEAAMRVAAIAERMGKSIPGAEVLTPMLAALGRDLAWRVRP